MCGIWAVFGLHANLYGHCGSTFTKMTHRGPDAWRVEYDARVKNSCLGFHRLTIVDSTYGMQPLRLHRYPLRALLCNGEIYNCRRLGQQFGFQYETGSDVECILHLYESAGGEECVRQLDGVFALCLLDASRGRLLLARDPYGVRPLFRLRGAPGVLALASEVKALVPILGELSDRQPQLEPFPPGTLEEYELLEDGSVRLLRQLAYHRPGDVPRFLPAAPLPGGEDVVSDVARDVRHLLTEACRKRLMADRRIGCLLSGGLDSSLVAALLVRLAREAGLPYAIQSFSVGMADSPDLRAARRVAEHIGTEHHELVFTEEDVRSVLDSVLVSLETADVTTVRASVGMYLVGRYIRAHTDTTVVLSGEGADELAQGYIYFRDAPGPEQAHEESVRLLQDIYLYDGLRADRTLAAHSLELRVPFLDLHLTSYFLRLPPHLRQPHQGVEKHLLRSAFADQHLLPDDILWRPKEAFSDGVASSKRSLFTVLQEVANERLSEHCLREAPPHPHCPPRTKEALYYRRVFEQHFPGLAPKLMPYFWMPKWTDVEDPSARFIPHYNADKQ